ncbi:glycoside hydrolase superfamily [Aspergillus egyptiacus]|nr:glycoside hydrolase superfamily [Aspergillus egyptiacus]
MQLTWLATVVIWTIPAALGREQVCPEPCAVDPSRWTPFSSLQRLDACDHPILLHIFPNRVSDAPDAAFEMLACTLDDAQDITAESISLMTGDSDDSETKQRDLLLDNLQKQLAQIPTGHTRSLLLYLNTTSLGFYSGHTVGNALPTSAIKRLRDRRADNTSKGVAIQRCGKDGDADDSFGIAIGKTGVMETIKEAINLWANGRCMEHDDDRFHIENFPAHTQSVGVDSHNNGTNGRSKSTCSKISVEPGDSCKTLAERCGIPGDDLVTYNHDNGLCASLVAGQEVCCSSRQCAHGKPSIHEDGSCATYLTATNDNCHSIAKDHSLNESDISYFNNGKTWGWAGCELIHAGLRICVSEGYPPMPVENPDAVCGPTVPGTGMPINGTLLAALNPCPLNACCNTLGECGVSPDFCIYEEGPTGNPGTARPGQKGCISNCGMDILDNSEAPAEFMKIGYYQSFNFQRPCLTLHAADIDVDDYSHIHWAFATINSTFHIGINDTYQQWPDFLALDGVKRIISFGGWGYTINAATYDVLRQAMMPENVDSFIANIMSFVEESGMDGVDFDWEYPGASDLPSVSVGLSSDGPNYLNFLKKLRAVFPPDKSISFAAPASYWFLRAFPIAEMWQHVDYIVYMTYDFHGQWEYPTSRIQDWCPAGNCLRSHMNLTETEYALAMITKAGVPRNKVAVGVASYGRAFGMSEIGCTRPECTFDGPQTTAIPGPCTRTPGILANAEIERIMSEGDINESYYDAGSDSNILVYNDTQWVSYMNESTMRKRAGYYQSLRFAGYVNWAIDLTEWNEDEDSEE